MGAVIIWMGGRPENPVPLSLLRYPLSITKYFENIFYTLI
jgi:hypothetical protein